MASEVLISVVVPVYRAQECLEELHRRVCAACEQITPNFELVLVDDCSPDQSWKGIEALAAKDKRVVALQLARNFGQHHAVSAGLTQSRGEWVIVMDCDLQDRPEEIPRLYAKAMEGHLCVMARRAARKDGAIKRLQSWAFYKVFAYLTDLKEFDGSVSNFSISHRQVITDVNAMGESIRFYPGFLFWLGYPSAFLEVPHDARFAGESSYTFFKLLRHSRNIILAHSTKPLRLCVNLGLAISLGAFVAALVYLVLVLFYGSSVTGWASLIISLYFSTGVTILTLGILGTYLAGIFDEVKRRPLFVVRRRINHV